MIDAAERARLREIAQKARAGPWYVSPWHVEEADETVRCKAGGHAITSTPASSDAAHIAAFDPPTVLSLLDALEKAEVEMEKARALLREALVMLDAPVAANLRARIADFLEQKT